MSNKKIADFPEGFTELVVGMGGCIASDRITVDALPVRFMFRTTRLSHPHDSGWAFLSGTESDEYMDEPKNHGVYEVNTIANYDRSIIPHLDTPAPCAFEKVPGAEDFIQVFDFDPDEMR